MLRRVLPDFLWNVWVPGSSVWHGEIELVSQSAWTGSSAILFLAVHAATALASGCHVDDGVGGRFCTALRLVGCRDNLALTVALLSPPSLACLVSGNVSLLLVFAVAVMSACGRRPWISGAALGLALAVKLWLWPLAAFLLFTRRWSYLAWPRAGSR